MRQRQAECLAYYLRSRCGSQELAAPAWRCTSSAAHVLRILERDLLLCEAGSDGLYLACVLAAFGQQRDSSGYEHSGVFAGGCQCHHHGRQALVARGYAENTLARWQGSHEPSQYHCSIIAERKRIHHARSALGSSVAGICARARKWDRVQRLHLAGRLGDEQPYFPMTGMEA